MVEMRRTPLVAAWARDPFGRFPHRLFDGRSWTDRVARGGRTLQDASLMGSPAAMPEPSTTCEECGYDVGGARFCPRCGNPAAPPRPPYCYQCGASPPAGSTFCHECGSRLDALPPGLSVRSAQEWRRIFDLLGWSKERSDPEQARQHSLEKPGRRGGNLPALLRELDLPAFDGDDPSEPWMIWLTPGSQRRATWLVPERAEIVGADESDKVDTLVITRCRLIGLSPAGLASGPTLVLTDSLANITDAAVSENQLRIAFGGRDRTLVLEWRVTNRATPLTPIDLRAVAADDDPPPPGLPVPLRRASDRREGGQYVAESVLGAFARQLTAIRG